MPAAQTSAESDGYEVPELAAADWMQHAELFASTSFWAVTRRLPAIVHEASCAGHEAMAGSQQRVPPSPVRPPAAPAARLRRMQHDLAATRQVRRARGVGMNRNSRA